MNSFYANVVECLDKHNDAPTIIFWIHTKQNCLHVSTCRKTFLQNDTLIGEGRMLENQELYFLSKTLGALSIESGLNRISDISRVYGGMISHTLRANWKNTDIPYIFLNITKSVFCIFITYHHNIIFINYL